MKIFVLLPRFPYPLEKGDKLRAYNQIRYLSEHHEIHLCALTDISLKEDFIRAMDPYCKTINVIPLPKWLIGLNIFLAFLKGLPLQVGYYYNRRSQRKIHKLIAEIQPDHIYCQLLRVAGYVRRLSIAKTLDYQDVFSEGIRRRLQASAFWLKPVLRIEYNRLCKYERDIFGDFDHKTIISKPDRALIPHPHKDQIEVVINGVDTDYYKPMETVKKYDLVFIGNMGYPPNVNASLFLVKKILPIVWNKRPDVKVTLVGAAPHPDVCALKSERVAVTGWVEDLREYYAGARIFIAPMQIGTGLQNKLLEAMAMRIPCITSPLANNALEAKDGEEIMVAQTPGEYAELILRLLEFPAEAGKIAARGHDFVLKTYNWKSATAKLEKLINPGK
jgi:sugar transferase (PEP-CTERM/EpsH1 system associated)